MSNKIVIDLDGTLALIDPSLDYSDRAPDPEVVAALKAWKSQGFSIVISTARNMRTYQGSIGHITANTVPVIIDWLKRHDIPYDEILIGKPWCGSNGFYVDDRAIRPSEFVSLTAEEIAALLEAEAGTRRS